MVITLKRAGVCRECGAQLPAGTRASWYRNGAVYGLNCHAKNGAAVDRKTRAAGGSHEDYPCSDLGYEDACAAACGVGL